MEALGHIEKLLLVFFLGLLEHSAENELAVASIRPKPETRRGKVAIKTEDMPDLLLAHEDKGRRVHKGDRLIGKFFHPRQGGSLNLGIDRQPSDRLALHLELNPANS